MTLPVTYVEIHTPELEETQRFLSAVFGWQPQPFVISDYLVAAHGDGAGVDTGLTASRDGQPRCVPVINVASLDDAVDAVRANGGNQVVEPYDVPGVGRACYIIDPTGVLIGLHQNDPNT
jgi:predicted enzyme related to lactoylglutathione lyase